MNNAVLFILTKGVFAMHDYLIFIGRVQMLHNGHKFVIDQALQKSKNVIFLLGSANRSISPKNPFTYQQRYDLLKKLYHKEINEGRFIIAPLCDTRYNDPAWVAHVQKTVYDCILKHANPNPHFSPTGINDLKIGIIGHAKDNTSYYLNLFPEWKKNSIDIQTQYGTLNSTQIREHYFQKAPILPMKLVPDSVLDYLVDFMNTDQFKWLVNEREFYQGYNKLWENSPYPVNVTCTDAVCKQSGNILLIERRNNPGKGTLALPGGHCERNETYRSSVIRELREETKISDNKGELPPAMLASFIKKDRLFDDPDRSERGWVTTTAYLFEFPMRSELYNVKGSDDAVNAKWYEIGTLDPRAFFEDHADIISNMTGINIMFNCLDELKNYK